MYLVVTNIFVEILLGQQRAEDCKRYLDEHLNEISVSSLSVHTVGIAVYRRGLPDSYTDFL